MQHFQVISNECGCDDEADHCYLGGLHLQPGEEDSSPGACDSGSDMSSDTNSDMYSQHSE